MNLSRRNLSHTLFRAAQKFVLVFRRADRYIPANIQVFMGTLSLFRKSSPAIAGVTVSLFLAGCASTPDARTTQAQGAGIGAVLGGLAGAAIGAASGGGRGALTGAAIGAAAGGVGGFVYGTHVANKKAAYARTEDWLDASIAEAKQANRSAYAYNQNLQQRVAALESRARAARASHDKAAITQIRSEVAALQDQSSQQSKALEEEIAAQRRVAGDADARGAGNYGALRAEVDGLQQNQSQLNRTRGRLATLGNQLDI
jgi:uncharacterized membrane protein